MTVTAQETSGGTSRTLRTSRLVPGVTEALVQRIVGGEFPAGGFLPREAELIAHYQVSRSVLREAIKVLEEKGLVAVRQGRGTTVLARSSWNLLDQMVIQACCDQDTDFQTSAKAVMVRAAIESDMAGRAAELITDDQQRELTRLVSQFDQVADDGAAFLDIDRAFHGYIIDIVDNELAGAVSRSTHGWVVQPAQLTNERLVETIPVAITEHQAICRAICVHDATAAAQAMRAHILDSWERTYRLLTDPPGS